MACSKIPRYQVTKGLSIIIYMEDKYIEGTTPGSKYGKGDFENIKKLWVKMNCDVRDYPNPSKYDMTRIVNDVKVILRDSIIKYDYMTVTFIGHGGSQECFDERGDNLDLKSAYLVMMNKTICTVKEFQSWFSAEHFPTLVGQPICLLLQACRGKMRETLLPAEASRPITPPSRVPESANVITIFASSLDHVSWYYPSSGQSVFLATLSDIFTMNFRQHDINALLILVKNKVAERNTPGNVQTIHIEESLLKQLIFPEDADNSSDSKKQPVSINPGMSTDNRKRTRTNDEQGIDMSAAYLIAAATGDINKLIEHGSYLDMIDLATLTTAQTLLNKPEMQSARSIVELAINKKNAQDKQEKTEHISDNNKQDLVTERSEVVDEAMKKSKNDEYLQAAIKGDTFTLLTLKASLNLIELDTLEMAQNILKNTDKEEAKAIVELTLKRKQDQTDGKTANEEYLQAAIKGDTATLATFMSSLDLITVDTLKLAQGIINSYGKNDAKPLVEYAIDQKSKEQNQSEDKSSEWLDAAMAGDSPTLTKLLKNLSCIKLETLALAQGIARQKGDQGVIALTDFAFKESNKTSLDKKAQGENSPHTIAKVSTDQGSTEEAKGNSKSKQISLKLEDQQPNSGASQSHSGSGDNHHTVGGTVYTGATSVTHNNGPTFTHSGQGDSQYITGGTVTITRN